MVLDGWMRPLPRVVVTHPVALKPIQIVLDHSEHALLRGLSWPASNNSSAVVTTLLKDGISQPAKCGVCFQYT